MKKLLSTNKFQIGFTLIELLIVITIIAVLVSFGAVAYSTAQRSARNAQRATDLQKIAAALEEYFADRHFYPTTNMNSHIPAQFETAGVFVVPPSDIDKIGCLLGDPTASNMPKFVGNWSCTQDASGNAITGPYNTYLANGDPNKVPLDPFYKIGGVKSPYGYGYASNGQTYVLVTRCYEGTAPTEHLFSNTNPYYAEAVVWIGSGNNTGCGNYLWTNQYYVTSPQG